MYKKGIVLLISIFILMFLMGCGGNTFSRSCDTLTGVNEDINEVYLAIQAVHNQDPNILSETDIQNLFNARSALMSFTDGICVIGETLED